MHATGYACIFAVLEDKSIYVPAAYRAYYRTISLSIKIMYRTSKNIENKCLEDKAVNETSLSHLFPQESRNITEERQKETAVREYQNTIVSPGHDKTNTLMDTQQLWLPVVVV